MKFKVQKAHLADVYRDVIRIPEKHRQDDLKHKIIVEGSLCRVKVGTRSIYAILRGNTQTENKDILIDERLRNRLNIKLQEEVDFFIQASPWFAEFFWAWHSSDPAYRINTRVALLSLILGSIGLILGIISLFH
jgi:hypothetical protein